MQVLAWPTLQVEYWYEPERAPLVQVRDCDWQVLPNDTDEDWYAAVLELWTTVCPLKAQALAALTLQEEYL